MNIIDKKAGKEGSPSLIEKREEKSSSVPSKPNEQSKLPSSTIISPPTTTLNSSNSTINSSSPNIFSADNPYHKSFLASMIIAIIIVIIFICLIIKKLAFYKTTNNRNLLLDSSMASNSSMSYESSSNYISRDSRPSNISLSMIESNLDNSNPLLIDLVQNNISNSDGGNDFVQVLNYVPNNCVADENSSFDVEIELPSSKTDVNWEDCMK